MRIEIWSDIFCPFCYIGKRRFESALQQFENKSEVEVIYRSFELNPNAKKHYDEDMNALIAKKYGVSYEKAKENNDNIVKQAAESGLTFRFDTIVPSNSFDAHRLIHFAAQHGKMEEMTEELFKAYFTDSKNISDHEILAEIAETVGLNKEETLSVLSSTNYAKEVRADEEEANRLGITSVPFFVFDRKFAVSGAQPMEVFLDALTKAWKDGDELINLENSSEVEGCADGSCNIPGR